MSPQRYERVSENDIDPSLTHPTSASTETDPPSSPPPSFRSRTSSPSSRRLLSSDDPITSDAERTLNDTFDDGSDSGDESGTAGDDRQRLMRSTAIDPNLQHDGDRPTLPRTMTTLPASTLPVPLGVPARPHTNPTTYTSQAYSNDGVFANLNAKPERGEKVEEQPPSYEAAAADATPPYWETTILAPGHLSASDEVYVDGLPVGSLFSFVWNAMISMSFSLVGFLLTYLLHTTHAAKNGSRSGLGVTLVQYGFYMRQNMSKGASSTPIGNDQTPFAAPSDPNSHDFDPNTVSDSAAAAAAAAITQGSQQATSSSSGGLAAAASSNWLSYALMIVGWFILIRAVSDFFKARRHEQLVLQSPDRGLPVPVVAENEASETVV